MSKQDKINYKKLEPHPLGAIFPPMSDEEYERLKRSIKENGFDPKHPIVIHEGKILDGNNRYTAAKAVRKEPEFRHYSGDDPFGFVISENLARRNLTPSQAAALGAEIVEKMKEAEKAEKEAAKAAKSGKQKTPATRKSRGTKARKAAAVVGVSERSVAAAAALMKSNPEEFEAVKKGTTRLNKAAKSAAEKKSESDKKSELFARAKQLLEESMGADFALLAEKKQTAKDFIKLSGIHIDELRRIRPLIEAGWTVSAALGYQSTQLSPAHQMRQFLERTVAQAGTFGPWTVQAFGKTFEVNIREVPAQ